jgi:hypothetical protein
MTKEELENNYEYKITKRALMKEFPFIKEISTKSDDDINRWKYSIYLEVVIDPYILGQIYGIPVWPYVTRSLQRGEPYWAPYLNTFFNNSDVIDRINREMGNTILTIRKSKALPDELKLNKELELGTFITYPQYLPPTFGDTMTLPN